jgi:hypothetical protein
MGIRWEWLPQIAAKTPSNYVGFNPPMPVQLCGIFLRHGGPSAWDWTLAGHRILFLKSSMPKSIQFLVLVRF